MSSTSTNFDVFIIYLFSQEIFRWIKLGYFLNKVKTVVRTFFFNRLRVVSLSDSEYQKL